ncbi:hypothetical protein [Sphingomonas sp. CFBP 13720]|uniref:hypothetical protein n=1 Tax=Sphingomonas sp. CFBP 13720 TaxID=2775302 RepID=UPI001784BA75|nr:hypothetical protein [Sphingomonas sp. CFBP 13720]MBD8679066.1 hypothetical protein [Sphingomonas sp. CFBP 13720]
MKQDTGTIDRDGVSARLTAIEERLTRIERAMRDDLDDLRALAAATGLDAARVLDAR